MIEKLHGTGVPGNGLEDGGMIPTQNGFNKK
jgi:hypothetical protein